MEIIICSVSLAFDNFKINTKMANDTLSHTIHGRNT